MATITKRRANTSKTTARHRATHAVLFRRQAGSRGVRGVLQAMSNRNGRNRKLDRRKRRRVGLKVRWRDVFRYGPLILLFLAFTFGPYVLHLYQHPSLWNGVVLVLAVVLVTGLMWPKLFPKKQSR